jgi:hypothetical protein
MRLVNMANKFKDKPKTRQDVREHARKPKGAKSAREIGMKKWSKAVPTGLREGHRYKKRTPNPLSAGGGNTYMVNGKLVTKEAFLKAKHRPRPKDLPRDKKLKKIIKGLTKKRKK